MIPLQSFELVGIDFGSAIFVIGLVSILAFVIIATQNVPALIAWGLSLLTLLFVGVLGAPVELFWLSLIVTTVLIIIGVAVRWET